MRIRRSFGVSCLGLLFAACAAQPKPVTTPGTGGSTNPAAGAAGAASPTATVQVGSLLEQIPETAVAALVVRPAALAMPRRWLAKTQAMRDELSRLLRSKIGVDLTAVRGLVAFATSLGPRGSGHGFGALPPPQDLTVLLLLDDQAARAARLRGPFAGSYRGVDLMPLQGKIVAALTPAGLLVGHPAGVKVAIDLAQRRLRSLGQRSHLAELLAADSRKTLMLGGLHLPSTPEVAAKAQQAGMEVATLTFDADQRITLRVAGDPQRMQPTTQLLKATMGIALATMQQKMTRALQGSAVLPAVTAIVGYYQARELINEVEPALVDGRLVSRYRLPRLDAGMSVVPIVGILAAVAIPAFIKYIRKSKTVEATEGLNKIKAGLIAHLAGQGRARLPRSTPWTPARPCCTTTGTAKQTKCPAGDPGFDHPTWVALQFRPAGPHYYQYRVVSDRRKNKVTIEARGDLDCDGVYSSYQIFMTHTGPKSSRRFVGPVITNELE